ncbi:LysR family transcriptional regulator [Pseudoalteromonas sp. BZK2]|uniref:LysR family transcriptional regulator n=2 Tax=Pseudoalteromonas TaxID=53246 RepID=UPI0016544D37|nr:LysR family transcriptional regulator [Pseudoalteromonas sp. BZK2]MBC7008197.1 LysR family transcriptional regulator [Pseudoalteromonas sp. BZK2]
MNKLEAVRALCLVAEYQSFTRAAKQMQLSTTMVSRHVKQLEQNLGCLLLKRNTRKVCLTDAGQNYVLQMKPLLNKFNEVDEEISGLSQAPSGKLAISASIEFGCQYLTPLISQYQHAFPDVKLDIVLSNTPVDLFDSQIDLAFRVAPSLPDANHIAQTVCHSSLSLWASPTYLKKHGTPIDIAALSEHRLLFFSHHIRHDQWIFLLDGQHVCRKFNWAMTSNNGRFLNEAAAAGDGIIQAPRYSVAPFLKSGELVEVLAQHTLNPLTIAAVYPHRYALSNRVKSFIELAKHYFSQHPIP